MQGLRRTPGDPILPSTMRRVLLLALVGCLSALTAPLTATAAATGGAEAVAAPGGVAFAPAARPRVREFTVTPGTVTAGARTELRVRIDGVAATVRARVEILRAGSRRISARIDLGREPTGRRVTRAWVPRTAGRYVARLHAVDPDGRRLARTTRASGRATVRVMAKPKPKPELPPPAPAPVAPPPPPAPVTAPAPAPAPTGGLFPVQGPYTFGADGSRFGAQRNGHVHQGQDVAAADGTPVVSPRAGVVHWRAYQAVGAGYYLVIRADDGRDLVFMHLKEGSLTVAKGDRVAAGQRIAAVGNSGASEGPHLHFEIWPSGWWEDGSAPIDPLPQLQAWAAG
jgi:murein DD-endopeptidase MepM/ murein hydrolase activator NlpD